MNSPDVLQEDHRRRTRKFLRIAAAALPTGIVVGLGLGFAFGVPVIGLAIGAGFGFGIAVVTFAAAIVARAADPDM